MFDYTKQDILSMLKQKLADAEKIHSNSCSDMGYWDSLKQVELIKANIKYLNEQAAPSAQSSWTSKAQSEEI